MRQSAIDWRGRMRIAAVLIALVPATLVLVALQWLALRFGWRLAEALPRLFHRMVCLLFRVSVTVEGAPAAGRPLLVLSNHLSWLDITVISSTTPLAFIAKAEVGTWPIFGTFARLQRTVFIDRTRRKGAAEANREVAARLAEGDAIVLFAEGTTSDGNRVLPFRSAVVGAAREAIADAGAGSRVLVQPLVVAYPRRAGLPVLRSDRPSIAWHGDMDLLPHLAALIAGPPLDAVVAWGDPVEFEAGTDRKTATRRLHAAIRGRYAELVTGRMPVSANLDDGAAVR